MNEPSEIFEDLIKRKGKISTNELDEFFATLGPVKMEEMLGEWTGGVFRGRTHLELLLKDYGLFKWYGKIFLNPDSVKAVVVSFLGVKISIPIFTAVIRELRYRGHTSTSMIYNYFPIIDNFRKIDEKGVMGIMEIKGEVKIYFYLVKV